MGAAEGRDLWSQRKARERSTEGTIEREHFPKIIGWENERG